MRQKYLPTFCCLIYAISNEIFASGGFVPNSLIVYLIFNKYVLRFKTILVDVKNVKYNLLLLLLLLFELVRVRSNARNQPTKWWRRTMCTYTDDVYKLAFGWIRNIWKYLIYSYSCVVLYVCSRNSTSDAKSISSKYLHFTFGERVRFFRVYLSTDLKLIFSVPEKIYKETGSLVFIFPNNLFSLK